MIQVLLSRSSDGLLQSCSAQGHANHAPKGYDIVCAAVTSLLRTVLERLEKAPSIVLDEEIPDRGSLAFNVRTYGDSDKELLKYSFEFLQTGISLVAEDYPESVQLRVN
ncbi:MAG: ribosomal-processing cysteine protease Prp [Treponemataceae bacterium]|nr:ribosomal-processing cysteine protease Prp [Treponemataceae bacterium]